MSDFVTVLDHIGSERTTIVSSGYGASLAVPIAASYPDRVSALVLTDPTVRLLRTDDFPWGITVEDRQQVVEIMRDAWGEGWTYRNPSFRKDPEARRWLARHERAALSKGHMASWWKDWDFDVRPLLGSIQAPTLVMHHPDTVAAPQEAEVQYVTNAIAGAVGPVAIPGMDLDLWASQPPMLADEIERFVTGSSSEHHASADRAFAVVLYTDLVGSTDQAVELGDRRWRELLEVHNRACSRQIETHRGRVVKSTGDGLLAVFDAPARAVRCAQAILSDIHQLGCEAYAGLHAGEIELLGDDIAGIAVHIAARVMGTARPGEVLVSRTIKDLVAGSGLHFEDRGTHMLKGVHEQWQLFAALA